MVVDAFVDVDDDDDDAGDVAVDEWATNSNSDDSLEAVEGPGSMAEELSVGLNL